MKTLMTEPDLSAVVRRKLVFSYSFNYRKKYLRSIPATLTSVHNDLGNKLLPLLK